MHYLEKPSSFVPYGTQHVFIDLVLLPAIKLICPSDISNRFGQSAKHFKELCRVKSGQYVFTGVYMDPGYLDHLSAAISRLVIESDDPRVSPFAGAFFVSHGYGLKARIQSFSDFYRVFDLDFVMDLVVDSPVFIDISMEQTRMLHGLVPTTTVWPVDIDVDDLRQAKVVHKDLLGKFLGDRPVYSSYYRLDPLMHFATIAGFDYKPPFVSGGLAAGIHAIKAYPTFKHLFYHRQANGEHTKRLHPIDIWRVTNTANTFFVSILIISRKKKKKNI